MAKSFSVSGVKSPGVKVRVGSSVPGDSSRARFNEAAGQKVASAQGSPIGKAQTASADPVAAASGSNMVMPVDHPLAKTTRTVTKGGTL